ncbi:hypothetical protein ES705_41833 [subsurface metagenome]
MTVLKKTFRRLLNYAGIEIIRSNKNKHTDQGKEISKYTILNKHLKNILKNDRIARPWYVWGVICGADLAKALNIDEISIIEFGVAGGNGLVELEEIANEVENIYNINITIYGFDTGTGLTKPDDYRDLPHLFQEGYFPMDMEKLRKRLHKAKIILGPIENTITDFIQTKPKPVAFIAFDMDLYSSTVASFKLLEDNEDLLLPRIHCYFDDIMGYSYSEFTGERLAIKEFNNSHELRKISPIFGLKNFVWDNTFWTENIYMVHIFNHKYYSLNDGMVINPELPLN